MSRGQRVALVLAAVVVAVGALIVIRPGGGDSSSGTGLKQQNEGTTDRARLARVAVKGGRPVGGVATLSASKGQVVRLVVDADAPEEVHVHGYDIARDVAPDKPVRFRFKATIEGVFDIELEHAGTQIAKLEVCP
jgi:hypothetical protein